MNCENDKEKQIALYLLSLLNRKRDSLFIHKGLANLDWDLFFTLAHKNLILLRVVDALESKGIFYPQQFLKEITDEKKRIKKMVELAGRINSLLSAKNISFILPSLLQHYPDMGGDIDLLIIDPANEISEILKHTLNAHPLKNKFINIISTESSFFIHPLSLLIEIHRGRLGLVGEHKFYPRLILKNRIMSSIDGLNIPVPIPEDQLLIQVIYRMYCRFYFRISDLISPIQLLHNNNLNWEYTIRTAKEIGIIHGLAVYLGYLNRMYQDLYQESLISKSIERALHLDNNKYLYFKRSYYRYSMASVTLKIYMFKMFDDILSARFASAMRILLIPYVAFIYLIRNIRGRKSRYFD